MVISDQPKSCSNNSIDTTVPPQSILYDKTCSKNYNQRGCASLRSERIAIAALIPISLTLGSRELPKPWGSEWIPNQEKLVIYHVSS